MALVSDSGPISLNPYPTFLGFKLDPKLGFKELVRSVLDKAAPRLNVIKFLSRKFPRKHVDHAFLVRIYKGFVRPLFDYNHILLLTISDGLQQKLQVFQNKCLRVCQGLPIFTRIVSLHQAANVPMLSVRLRTLSSAYFSKAMGFNSLVNEDYILYNNDLSVKEGRFLVGRKPYRTPFGILSGLVSTD